MTYVCEARDRTWHLHLPGARCIITRPAASDGSGKLGKLGKRGKEEQRAEGREQRAESREQRAAATEGAMTEARIAGGSSKGGEGRAGQSNWGYRSCTHTRVSCWYSGVGGLPRRAPSRADC